MSSALDIDEILGRALDFDPGSARDTEPAKAEYGGSLKDHVSKTTVVAQCPTCGTDMGDKDRFILVIVDPLKGRHGWDACSLGCAHIFFRKKYPGVTRGIASSIHRLSRQQLYRRMENPNQLDQFDFRFVYDR